MNTITNRSINETFLHFYFNIERPQRCLSELSGSLKLQYKIIKPPPQQSQLAQTAPAFPKSRDNTIT